MNWLKAYVGSIGTQDIYLVECTNMNGQTVQILNYGGIVHKWLVPINHAGKSHDILLGKDDLNGYLTDQANFGCIIGRYANRIAGGRLVIDNQTYLLSRNLNGHHLHGGFCGFGKKVWNIDDIQQENDQATLILSYESPDGEEGYPGNLKTEVKYTFTNQNELIITFYAQSDKNTVCNLTNHCYFNLGNTSQILDHELQIKASQITETDENLIPTGKFTDVQNTIYDFTKPRALQWKDYPEADIVNKQNGYDNNFVINDSENYQEHPVAVVTENENRLILEVFSSKPGIQLYTGNWLEGVKGKNNTIYQKNAGFCLEAQYFPDSPNHPEFPDTLLEAGTTYRQYLKYKLTTK